MIAHAGDGNTHPLIVFDPMDADQGRRAQAAYGEIMTLAIGLGGTITGEHGVGRLKGRGWVRTSAMTPLPSTVVSSRRLTQPGF